MNPNLSSLDKNTADAFASSWNNLPLGSIYTKDQFEDWMFPIKKQDIEGKTVLELGCGNASLMIHMAQWRPSYLLGVDLGGSVDSAVKNMSNLDFKNWKIVKKDLIDFNGADGYDLVYSIGVLHHLKNPKKGLDAVVNNVKSGGKFHCWVYAREGNDLVVWLVDPIRKIVSFLPWWAIKYFVVIPLVFPYFLYAKTLSYFKKNYLIQKMPLYQYSLWIAKRNFSFFRHVALDQLITPQTIYLDRITIESWLKSYLSVDQSSTYIILRNGNSWKFGGKKN